MAPKGARAKPYKSDIYDKLLRKTYYEPYLKNPRFYQTIILLSNNIFDLYGYVCYTSYRGITMSFIYPAIFARGFLKKTLRTILKKSLKFYQTFLYLSNSAILSI